MTAYDLDPHYGLPLWRALVAYFRHYPPLVHAPQPLPSASGKPPTHRRGGRKPNASRRGAYLPREIERRLPIQPSP
ncbi:MAG: hypothetical protein ACM3ZT_03555 [Bacillota bacterium]